MKVKPSIYAFIFARGGSKGVQRKNIRLLAGKPLMAYAIETALKSEYIDRVIVSTEDAEIADVALQYGAEVPFMRPLELAQDDSPEWEAWRHAVEEMERRHGSDKMDIFVSLPPTSPLRRVEDVDACILAMMESDADIVITIRKANRHPSFNMVTLDKYGYAGVLMPLGKTFHRRQDFPPAFDMTTVAYVARPEFIKSAREMFHGRVKAVVIPEERALDIDTELDFTLAEFLALRDRKEWPPRTV